MHKLNVIVLGSQSFISTINELSVYLKFNISSLSTNDIKNIKEQNGLILCDDEFTDNKTNLNLLKDTECVKILANHKKIKINTFSITPLNFQQPFRISMLL